MRKHRYWLGLIVVLALGAMAVGIMIVAHTFYVGFGGQGFLKRKRGENFWAGGDIGTRSIRKGERVDDRTQRLRIKLNDEG